MPHTAPPLSWIRRFAPEIKEFDQIPLFGNAPPFDWHRFSSSIASRFGIQKFSISPEGQEWREGHELKKGLGPNLTIIPITVSPLNGNLFWIMSRDDISRFASWMINGKTRSRPLSSETLQEGFYRYLCLEALDVLQGLDILQGLTLHINEEAPLSEERCYCIDVEISFDEKASWGRLAIPSEFRKAWVHYFSQLPSEYIPSDTARLVPLHVSIKTGSVLLHLSEWKQMKEGDFLLLDAGSYDVRHGTGVATLMLGPTPLFNVKIKQNKIELLDYAFYYEDNMQQNAPGSTPQPAPAQSDQPAEGEVVAIKEMPLYVTIELARLKITLDQLMHLNPGNVLELPVHPDQGVSLIVNGQKVGRAELVYLGENLGVRILEMG